MSSGTSRNTVSDPKKQEDSLTAVTIAKTSVKEVVHTECIMDVFISFVVTTSTFYNCFKMIKEKTNPFARDVNFIWSCGKP